MKGSSNTYISGMFKDDPKFAEPAPDEGGSRKKKKLITVSSEFKDQLQNLMDTVNKTEPHFIRCIKPNPQNQPDIYDRPHVTEQLRYGGVLQVVQVSRAGYPVRINHVDCWMDYKVIASLDVIKRLQP